VAYTSFEVCADARHRGYVAALPLSKLHRKMRDDVVPHVQAEPPRSTNEWFQVLYHELRRRARGELFRHQAMTLGPTTLLHETWLQLGQRDLAFATQAELVGYAARTMRGIVIDHVRARVAGKRGGGHDDLPYETSIDLHSMPDREIMALGDALAALAHADAALCELVELKFFAGLTFDEVAALRSVSKRTVQRDWEKARTFLYDAMPR
jgi:RNA polymerase sigma factor (TIGR02999 family)